MVLDFLSLIAYAILANKLIVWLKANPKVINTISACVLIIIAIIIAITQQYYFTNKLQTVTCIKIKFFSLIIN